MELDKLGKLEQEPPLSGAYMRSLVKQLAKDSMNPKDQNCVMNLSKHGKVVAQQQSTELPQQQHKKQVRRRLHTSKPYQERLLNMAEARREIVTALKFHRAAMKEASEQQHHHHHHHQQQQQQHHHHHQQQRQQDHPPPLVPNSYTWHAASPIAQPHLMAENPNFILPNQTLGLNLNFHDFNNLDATVHLNNTSSSSSLSYSSGTLNSYSQEVPSVGKSQVEGFPSIEFNAATQQVTGGLHTAMDDEAMAEIRSLGDQYQMEWNDTMNLVKSACWFKFLKNMEHDGAPEAKGEDYAYRDFDQFLEFPAWLNANESCLEQCSEDYFHDSTLPCMDIGDTDGMDDDWLA